MSIYLENLQVRLVEELRRVGPPVIAKQTGIARATVYNWMEKGNVPMDKLALLEVAGADVNYILTGERDGPAPVTLSAEEETMLAYFREASKEVRRAALGALLGASAPVGGGQQVNSASGAVQVLGSKNRVTTKRA